MAPDPADGGPRDRSGGGAGREGGEASFDRALIELTDDDRRARARAQRRHEQWARRASREGGSMAGVLVELGEHGRLATLHLRGGHHIAGTVVSVSADSVILEVGRGARSAVFLPHLDAVSEEPSAHPTVGERTVADRASWRSVLEDLAEASTPLTLRTLGGERWVGQILHLGLDLLVVRAGRDGSRVTVSIDAVCEVTWT